MNKKTNYKIFKAYNLIIELYRGTVGINDILDNKQKSSTDKNYNPNFAILLDFREAHINISPKELNKLFDWLKKHPLFQGQKKVAYLTSEPNEVVLTTLFKMKLDDIPIDAAVFHTIAPALNWLGITGLTTNELENLITEVGAQ